jgi:hypothetical protein
MWFYDNKSGNLLFCNNESEEGGRVKEIISMSIF